MKIYSRIARSLLGMVFIYGTWVHSANAMGDVAAEALAVSAFKGDTAALGQLRRLASGGDATAQDWLGAYHQRTGGIARAVFWYEKAAKQGNITAQNNLGILYPESVFGADRMSPVMP